jgi:hypothetical protein
MAVRRMERGFERDISLMDLGRLLMRDWELREGGSCRYKG